MSKKQNHWWPRYQDDYTKKTSHLSLAEHGAYAVLLDHYYATERPLDANASVLHRVCRAFAPEEQAAVQSVLRQFFVLTPEGYRNKRADEELEKRMDISEKRRKSALLKHKIKRQKNRDANAPANAPANAYTPTPTPTQDIKISDLATTAREAGPVDNFDDLPDCPGGYSVTPHLTSQGWDRAAEHAPGWDIRRLAEKFSSAVNSGAMQQPKFADAAFSAWCLKITGGKPPL